MIRISEIWKRLYRKEKILIALVGIAILLGVATASIYWSRTIHHEFYVKGITAYLMTPTYDGYVSKVEPTDLSNNQLALALIETDIANPTIRITIDSDLETLTPNVTGRYYQVYYDPSMSQGRFKVIEELSDFDIPLDDVGYTVPDAEIVYFTWTSVYMTNKDMKSYCMVLTFNFNTDGAMGNYYADITITLGD